MQFTFNKSCFLAYLQREEPLLTAAAKLDEVLNASRESMASCLKSSLSVSGAETAICRHDKRWREEISMTLMSSDIEQLVMKPPPPTLMGPVPSWIRSLVFCVFGSLGAELRYLLC